MKTIIYYMTDMLPYMLMMLPLLIIGRAVIYAVRKRYGLKPNLFHEIGVAVFILFLTGLASQTLIPIPGYTVGLEINGNTHGLTSINLIPFQSLVIIGRMMENGVFPELQVIQFFGNVGMFLVPGFLLPLVWHRFENMKRTILTTFFISLTIEVTQLFTGRSTDIDDIILNTLGGLLGYLLYTIVKKSSIPNVAAKFKAS